MTPLEILKEARATLATPGKWTRGALARSSLKACVDPCSEEANAFCTVGALQRAAHVTYEPCVDAHRAAAYAQARSELRATLASRDDVPSLTHWNDHYTRQHAEVLELFDETIKRLETATCPTRT